jgi:hypothetical protein
MSEATPAEKEILLSGIESAIHRARLDASELKGIGLALRDGTISCAQALDWLEGAGLCGQVEGA